MYSRGHTYETDFDRITDCNHHDNRRIRVPGFVVQGIGTK